MSILDKIKKAREFMIEVEGVRFTLSRPTDLEAITMKYESVEQAVLDVPRFVVGWSLQEIDLFPGGNAIAVEPEAEVVSAYLADRPDMWMPLIEALKDSYSKHSKKREERSKN